MPKTRQPKAPPAKPRNPGRDHAVVGHVELENAVRATSRARLQFNSVDVLTGTHPVIVELVKASDALVKALAHARELLARMP